MASSCRRLSNGYDSIWSTQAQMCSNVRPWLGLWLCLCDWTATSLKSYFNRIGCSMLSLQFVKGLRFELRIIARISSGASMLRKRSGFTCRNLCFITSIQAATGFPWSAHFRGNYCCQRSLNLIRPDRHRWDWNPGPTPVMIKPP